MSNLQEKVNKEYPLYDIQNSVLRTDEYNGNEIQFIKRIAFQNGYEQCQKEYEEKLRWIPISKKMPEPRKDISLKLENFTNSEITGFMGYSGEFYIKLTDIIDCDNVKLKCKVTHWRSFL